MLKRSIVAWGACTTTGAALAAGGHFDVDDASVLAPGHCQYEVWLNRAPASDATGVHLGPSCRISAFEIGIDLDRISKPDATGNALSPHLKWATTLVDGLAVGAVVGSSFDLRRGSRPVQSLYAPATWTISSRWALNLNYGWDRSDEGVTRHVGASAEWSPNRALTVIGEQVRTGGALVSRLGARLAIASGLSLDLSLARAGSYNGRLYTIGLNHDFQR